MRKVAPLRAALLVAAALMAAGPVMAAKAPREAFPNIGYADWTESEPEYRFYPGDQIDVTVPSAPELARTGVIVQPDGRITLPLLAPVMAADRTILELQGEISRGYASQLLRPEVQIQVKGTTPLKVFVGGEVGTPGVFDMAGDINSLQAIFQAGGFKPSAKTDRVVIIRRGPDGRAMMRTVNLQSALKRPGADLVPLRRFDVIYVPRSNIAEAGLFMQQWFRDISPIQGFSYAIGGQNGQ
jgi:protein involved in polysaccharide export with SLBB domain